MEIDAKNYRTVLSYFPTGVTVVTGTLDGRPIGFTIGSFTSVSLDPPLVGFLPMIDSDRWQDIRKSEAFCVNVLADDQDELCWTFSKSSIDDPFEGVGWTPSPVTGSPLIDGCAAWIDCTIEQVVDAGDHHFVMGRIRDFDHASPERNSAPLVFCKGTLGSYAPH